MSREQCPRGFVSFNRVFGQNESGKTSGAKNGGLRAKAMPVEEHSWGFDPAVNNGQGGRNRLLSISGREETRQLAVRVQINAR